MIQRQNYSLAALAKRDARDDPFSTAPSPPAADAEKHIEIEAITGPYQYDPSRTYAKGEFVISGGRLWHADINVKGIRPGDGALWSPVVKH